MMGILYTMGETQRQHSTAPRNRDERTIMGHWYAPLLLRLLQYIVAGCGVDRERHRHVANTNNNNTKIGECVF